MAEIDLLMTRLAAAIKDELPDRQVIDSWLGEDLDARVVAIAFDSSGGQSPVITTEVVEDDAGLGSALLVSVSCTAVSWDGDVEAVGKRRQVEADLAAVTARMKDECKSTARLDGLVLDVWVAPQMQWYVLTDDRGPSVQCDFTIRARMHQ
jgi:hypothetical protein